MAIVEFKGVSRVYTSGDHVLKALDDVNMSLEKGKFVVILGPSGAGKSTLLNLIGGLDSPTEGQILVDGKDISKLTSDELAEYRAAKVGFVFQFYNLIPTLTVKENVELVKEIAPKALPADKMLGEVGLADHLNNFPSELSGEFTGDELVEYNAVLSAGDSVFGTRGEIRYFIDCVNSLKKETLENELKELNAIFAGETDTEKRKQLLLAISDLTAKLSSVSRR